MVTFDLFDRGAAVIPGLPGFPGSSGAAGRELRTVSRVLASFCQHGCGFQPDCVAVAAPLRAPAARVWLGFFVVFVFFLYKDC